MFMLARVMLACLIGAGLLQVAGTYVSARWRLLVYGLAATLQTLGAGLLVGLHFDFFGCVTALASLYLLVNAARALEGRMHDDYLRTAVRRTAVLLSIVSILGAAGWFFEDYGLNTAGWVLVAWGVSLSAVIVSSVMLATVLRRLHGNRLHRHHKDFADKELPTVTVAIPARNETETVAAALESILASNYPKLEILVLDDSSQDRTPEVIRSYANAGVRFVEGLDPPDQHWLHKNYAYETLLKHAVGEYMLFCGVDIRFGAGTIRELVSQAKDHKLEMAGVLPRRAAIGPFDALIQPMRYWWQLAVPKELFGRAPALSSCWLVNRKALTKAGGFKSVSRMVTPENWFAREFQKRRTYRFLLADGTLDVTSVKDLREQYRTAVRTRYPDVRRRPEGVLAFSLFSAGCLVLPFVLPLILWATGFTSAGSVALVAAINLILANVLINAQLHPVAAALAIVNFPLVAALDMLLLNWSMLKYEFGTVSWKGRNVTTPVMHIVPHLPKLD